MLVMLGRINDWHMRVLARVERDVRALEQLLGVGAVLREDRDADAGLELELEVFDDERLFQRAANSLCNEQRAGGVLRAEQHEREFVAAESRAGVARTRGLFEAVGPPP